MIARPATLSAVIATGFRTAPSSASLKAVCRRQGETGRFAPADRRGGRVENLARGVLDHQSKNKVRQQPTSGHGRIACDKAVYAQAGLQSFEGQFYLPSKPIGRQHLLRRCHLRR